MDVAGALYLGRPLNLLDQILWVADACRCGVRDPVGHHYLHHVLLGLLLPFPRGADRSGRCPGAFGRQRGALDPGVHVGLVVVTNVDEIVAPLHGPAEGLDPDVVGITAYTSPPYTRFARRPFASNPR